ncbi:TetR/AcrR family transcriptional regulator [Mycobacterium sp. SM1]|uniref:TetR/AcrR family transcriptional regulator n=1 Tax=Mycobacterium sp. SM1 TaxID=2816243 RepID=UPI001BD0FD9B|nr:TetR/AcrR family transcriptional regulator [Mycobacterium sp. SM1]MBS4727874.1 TetR/AcrR family transcriptional regulator [Mycobacterium sp. SM1]
MPQTARRGPGRPPAAKAAETRKRIIRAAREVFSERGYDAATFQAIAVRADLTRPAINHYFPNKRVLYREVVEQTNDLLVTAAIERAQRETTLPGRLSAFISAAIQADAENRSAAAFLVTSMLESQRHPDISGGEHEALRAVRAFLAGAVNEAIERGELAIDADASSVAETLLAVLCGVGFYAGFLGERPQVRAVSEGLRQLLAGALSRAEPQG